MTKKWIAITLLLLAITGLLGRWLYISVLRFYVENDLSKIQPVRDAKQKISQENPLPPLAQIKKYSPMEFGAIPESNVFSEFRAKEEKVEIAAPPEPPPLAQKPILVGVSIADGMKKASIIDPTSPTQEKVRRAQIKRIGDVFHGYTITDITMNNIILESGTRREIIPLHEGSKRTQTGKTPILSTRVVQFGGGSSGGVPVGVAGGGSAKPVAAASPSPGSTPSSASTPAPAQQQRPGQTNVQPATAPPAAPRNQTIDSQGRRVIRTPFGDVVRPN